MIDVLYSRIQKHIISIINRILESLGNLKLTIYKMKKQSNHLFHQFQENKISPYFSFLFQTTIYDCTINKSSGELLADIYELIANEKYQKEQTVLKQNNTWKCKCKKTKCLKLYCECFAFGQCCKDCNCLDCHNILQYQEQRAAAIDQALERDANAFNILTRQKKGGCICKKTFCIKKYCQCYNNGDKCTSDCKCINCENRMEKAVSQNQYLMQKSSIQNNQISLKNQEQVKEVKSEKGINDDNLY